VLSARPSRLRQHCAWGAQSLAVLCEEVASAHLAACVLPLCSRSPSTALLARRPSSLLSAPSQISSYLKHFSTEGPSSKGSPHNAQAGISHLHTSSTLTQRQLRFGSAPRWPPLLLFPLACPLLCCSPLCRLLLVLPFGRACAASHPDSCSSRLSDELVTDAPSVWLARRSRRPSAAVA